jgi:hypothetical protein
MSKKYRQRGYQDESPNESQGGFEKPRADTPARGPRRGYGSREPEKVNMPGFREVLKCARCGNGIVESIDLDTQCQKCLSDLHSCAQCTWFDTGRPFECGQSIPHRVSPKDTRNTCTHYEARVTVERETHSTVISTQDGGARQAFDDLFK